MNDVNAENCLSLKPAEIVLNGSSSTWLIRIRARCNEKSSGWAVCVADKIAVC